MILFSRAPYKPSQTPHPLELIAYARGIAMGDLRWDEIPVTLLAYELFAGEHDGHDDIGDDDLEAFAEERIRLSMRCRIVGDALSVSADWRIATVEIETDVLEPQHFGTFDPDRAHLEGALVL